MLEAQKPKLESSPVLTFLQPPPWRPLPRGMQPGTDSEPSEILLRHSCSDSSVRNSLLSKKILLILDSENAVDPQNFEPNLALDLEIADLINSKKGNAYETYHVSPSSFS